MTFRSESAVGFGEASYLRFLHGLDDDAQDFNLSLRFKTFQEEGVIVFANGSDWGVLQVRGLEALQRTDCISP